MRYLLDSTLLIDHATGRESAMALLRKLYEDGAELFTCDIVVCETLSGETMSNESTWLACSRPWTMWRLTAMRRAQPERHVWRVAGPEEDSRSPMR